MGDWAAISDASTYPGGGDAWWDEHATDAEKANYAWLLANPQSDEERVFFGKYKGARLSVLLADAGYCDWLLAQEWFEERHPTVYWAVTKKRETQ